ncbi:glycine betaine/L-proline ABC transporter ATP-binding protein [Klenkia sp. LSe6-5]|uniref:Glycine betaine/L-proline ABC transporter ATP-binding protein n=1 Tax=Klenkia sesuvii TaxID=3103137 RepID=A0ABU8DXT4_9ACTN
MLHARGLYKVFGRRPEDAVRRLQEGATVADVRDDGATPAVVDVGFTVRPGEIFVVMGLSGSGKSTLLRMLNGLLPPTAGSVTLDGEELTELDRAGLRRVRQERMSMVFQHFALLPHRSVLQNAAYALEVRGVDRRTRSDRAREALSLVGLADRADASPAQLSGGMQQRVGLARALAADTDLLLMDEAFSALDPLIRRGMQDQLLDLQRDLGKTIVFITHDLNEAMRLGDRVAVMRDGRIVQCDTPEQILTAPADDYVAQFLADVDRSRVVTAGSLAEPVAVLPPSAGPGETGAELARTGADHLVLAEPGGPVHGVLAAADAGSGSAGQAAPPAACVPADAPLADLLGPAAATGHPVVVVDEARRPVGVVPVTALLAALSPAAGEPGAHDGVPAGAPDAELADRRAGDDHDDRHDDDREVAGV